MCLFWNSNVCFWRTEYMGCDGNDPAERFTYMKSNRGLNSAADYPFEGGWVRTHTWCRSQFNVFQGESVTSSDFVSAFGLLQYATNCHFRPPFSIKGGHYATLFSVCTSSVCLSVAWVSWVATKRCELNLWLLWNTNRKLTPEVQNQWWPLTLVNI